MRVLLAALVFMFSLSGWAAPSAKEEPARRPHGQDNKADAGTYQHQPAPVITITNNLAPASETKPKSKEHSESAASAEERVALWTERLTYVTGALAVFTLMLWIATYCLFREGKHTARRQLRAYVMIDKCLVRGTKTQGGLHEDWINLTLKNFGQTPAKNISYWIEMAAKSAKAPTRLIRQNSTKDAKIEAIAPGSEFITKCEIPLLDGGNDIRGGVNALYVFGAITYFDVFDDERTTEFRFSRSGEGWTSDGEMETCQGGNKIT